MATGRGRLTMHKPRELRQLGPSVKTAQPDSLRHRSRGAWDALRHRILQRDMGLCQVCKAAGRVRAAREVDHVKPVHDGGTDTPSNLQAICIPCHKAKTAEEAKRRSSA